LKKISSKVDVAHEFEKCFTSSEHWNRQFVKSASCQQKCSHKNTFSSISLKTEHQDDNNALLLHKALFLHGLPEADFNPFLFILALLSKRHAKIVTCHVGKLLNCQHLEHEDGTSMMSQQLVFSKKKLNFVSHWTMR